MVEPKTYTGYDKDSVKVATITAVDANEYLNPDEVQKAIDNLEAVATEQLQLIAKALSTIAYDASHAVVVKSTNMQQTIDEMAAEISNGEIVKSIVDNVSEMHTVAIEAHDQLQNNANDDAYNTILNSKGVEIVR